MRADYETHRGTAIAAYIDDKVMGVSGYDEMTSHPVVSEGAALIGRRVFCWDDFGFIDVTRFDTVDQARVYWEAIDADYSDADEIDEEDEDQEDEDAAPANPYAGPGGLLEELRYSEGLGS